MRTPQSVPHEQPTIPPFSAWASNQDGLAIAWKKSLKYEADPDIECNHGRPSKWAALEILFARHGELTTGDIATMTGRSQNSASTYLSLCATKGLVQSRAINRGGRVTIWRVK